MDTAARFERIVLLTMAFGPAMMTAIDPATGSKASHPGKRISGANEAAEIAMAAMPVIEITCLRLALRLISGR